MSSWLQPELRTNHGSSHELVEAAQVEGESRRLPLSLHRNLGLSLALQKFRANLESESFHRPLSENLEAQTPLRESLSLSSSLSSSLDQTPLTPFPLLLPLRCYNMLENAIAYMNQNDVYIGWAAWAAGPRTSPLLASFFPSSELFSRHAH